MSNNTLEQLQMIRIKKTAFYKKHLCDLNRPPQITVIKPIVTQKYISGSVQVREVSKELILG